AVLGVKLLAELRPPRVRHLLRNARSLARPTASAPPRPFGVSRCRLWSSDLAGNADERGAHPPWPDVEVDAVSLTGRVTRSRVRVAVPLDGLDASIRERLDDESDVVERAGIPLEADEVSALRLVDEPAHLAGELIAQLDPGRALKLVQRTSGLGEAEVAEGVAPGPAGAAEAGRCLVLTHARPGVRAALLVDVSCRLGEGELKSSFPYQHPWHPLRPRRRPGRAFRPVSLWPENPTPLLACQAGCRSRD